MRKQIKPGRGALYDAAEQGNNRQVSVLLLFGKDPDKGDTYGITPLQVAAWNNHCKVLQKLTKHSSDVDLADKVGHTALFKAVWKNCDRCVRLLLDAGANCNVQDNTGTTPLLLAAELGFKDIMTILLQRGARTHLRKRWGESALHIAVLHGNVSCVKLLLGAGASPDIQTHAESTPLFFAAGRRQCGTTSVIVDLLISAYCNLDMKGREPDVLGGKPISPFELAVQRGNFAVASLLYKAGCNINAVFKWRRHPKLLPDTLRDEPECLEILEGWAKKPKSLKELSRIAIRGRVRDHRGTQELPLPKPMVDYVLLKELSSLEHTLFY